MRNNIRLGIAVASVAVASLALTGCGGGSEEATGAEAKTPESITWMTMLHTPTTPEADGPIETALEEYTGTDLDLPVGAGRVEGREDQRRPGVGLARRHHRHSRTSPTPRCARR